IPKELGPLYILIWRSILSYFTLAFGFLVFWRWVHGRLKTRRAIDEPDDDDELSLPDPALTPAGPAPSAGAGTGRYA
ncbi:MAG TPA: hypothetical protein VNH46_08140, partial [Gemmatimonadales bacterium]|nr:hypothetical protein [Gemmatimonadales bacterium]